MRAGQGLSNVDFEDCGVDFNTYSGANGSVNTAQMRFTNLGTPRGVGLTVLDTVADGTTVRVDRPGFYFCELTMTKVAGATTLVGALGRNTPGAGLPTIANTQDFATILGVAAETPIIKLARIVRVTPVLLAAGTVLLQALATDGAGATAAALVTPGSARWTITRLGGLNMQAT